MIRTGIIGSGFAAHFHFEALRRVYGTKLTIAGVYSRTQTKRDIFATQRKITSFATFEEALEKSDVIHICTPAITHTPLAVQALSAGKSVIIEKPFSGYFGDSTEDFSGLTFDRLVGRKEAVANAQAIIDAEITARQKAKTDGTRPPVVCYAENWVYAPAIQKEREILEKTGAQILWMHGEESHSGSHSPYYGMWKYSGGGSIIGKGVHPLTAALYLKGVEGRVRQGKPIRPMKVSARTHSITKNPGFVDQGHIRTSYTDVEDFGAVHVTFEDNTIADIFATELVIGGVHNWLEVNTVNHRTVCNINPNNSLMTYNPLDENFKDIYVVEKIGTKQGWAFTSLDEDWFTGYQHEIEAFYRSISMGTTPESDSLLGLDTVAVVYAAYLSASLLGTEVDLGQASKNDRENFD